MKNNENIIRQTLRCSTLWRRAATNLPGCSQERATQGLRETAKLLGRRNVCLIENPLEYKANKWRLTGDGVRRLVRDKSPSVKAHKWGVSLLTPPKWRPNIFRSKSAARCEKSVQNAGRLQETSNSMVQNLPNAMACRNRSR